MIVTLAVGGFSFCSMIADSSFYFLFQSKNNPHRESVPLCLSNQKLNYESTYCYEHHKKNMWYELDVVRLVAMFTIVCCHSADPFNFYPGEPPANIDEIKFWGAAYGAFLRPCVHCLS